SGVEQMMGYAPTLFPGTMSMNEARRITVGVGQVASNSNFSMIPGRAATVSGTAYDSTGRPLANRGVQVTQEAVGPGMMMSMSAAGTTTAGDGTFTLKNIPPGSYHLRSQGSREGAQGQPIAEAVNMPLELAGVDVTDIALTTSAGWSI